MPGPTVIAALKLPGDPASTVPLPPQLLQPVLLFLLATAAAVGIILLLPGRKEAPLRAIGGVVLAAAALIFAAVVGKSAAGMGVYFWIFSAIAVLAAVRVVTHPRPVYSALYFVLTVMASAALFVLMAAEFMAAALVLIYAGAILVTYVFVIMLAAEATPAREGGGMRQQLADHDAISREPVIASAVGFALLGVLLFVVCDRSQNLRPVRSNDVSASLTPLLRTQEITSEVFTVPTTQPSAGPYVKPVDRSNFTTSKNLSYSYQDPFPQSGDATPVEWVAADAPKPQPSLGFNPVGGTQKLGAYLFSNQLINLELAGLILTVAMVGAIVIARKRVVGGSAFDESMPEQITGPATPVDDNPHSIPVVGTENPRQKEYPET